MTSATPAPCELGDLVQRACSTTLEGLLGDQRLQRVLRPS